MGKRISYEILQNITHLLTKEVYFRKEINYDENDVNGQMDLLDLLGIEKEVEQKPEKETETKNTKETKN